MTALRTRAELLKLGRTLGAEPEALAFLEDADPADLRLLRECASEALFASDRVHFERVAVLSSRIPRGLSAQLAQHALGARLAARTAGLVDPSVATDLARRLPTPFLADIATHADPRALAPLLGHLPAEQVAAVTEELAARQEWLTMGAFVGHLDDRALAAAIGVLDGEALLRTGFVMDDPGRVADVLALLDDDRLRDLLETAAAHGLWAEALELALEGGAQQRPRLTAALGALDEAAASLAAAAEADPDLARAAAELGVGATPPRARPRA